MRLVVNKSELAGSVEIPGSKSHTIRGVAIASLAEGTSRLRKPLQASDTLAVVDAYSLLGAEIEQSADWVISGVDGKPGVPQNVVDVGNSGTTLYIAMGSAALINGGTVLTGDEQIRRRPVGPLMDALNDLGARAESLTMDGTAPVIVYGPMRGGRVKLDCSKTSQYLTSLLINCPLAPDDTHITAHNLVEKPYIEMTLRWLEEQGIEVGNDHLEEFHIRGGQSYHAFDKPIPADFSSATFFMCAAAITRSKLKLVGLDPRDTQGDKAIVDVLRHMGAGVHWDEDSLTIEGHDLLGGEFDLADTPDALPALAVTACFAEGETRLMNVAQARLKETDRIAVMCRELKKMGADIEELPDGLVIRGKALHAAAVHGHSDHRVIMALAMAGLAVEGKTKIDTAEALSVTFPTFVELMKGVGANISIDA